MATSASPRSSIKLDAIDKAGRQRTAVLKATVIGGGGDEPTSNADEPDPFSSKALGRHKLISPPYDLSRLIQLKEQSTILEQSIQTMVTNTVGFGYTLRERDMPEAVRKQYEGEILSERFRLNALLESVHPTRSITALRKRAKNDQHSCGNGYLEMIDAPKSGDLIGINHTRGHLVRLTEQDDKPTRVKIPRVRPDQGFRIEEVDAWYRFRKYVMLRGNKAIWFKEAGDTRILDKLTGEYGGEEIQPRRRATSLLHFHNYFATTPYGLPLWIGNMFAVCGTRDAELVNYTTLANNNIPSCFVIVENGALTEASIERLREWTEEQIQKSANRSKFILLEGDVLEEGGPNPTNFKIRIEPMKSVQDKDELYSEYIGNNNDRVRQSFRLPPIFVGRSDDYTRATADTSRDIADEQVFAPERADDDHMMNRHVLLRWGARFHTFRSNHPNITDDIELIRMAAIGERSGAMTPRRMDRIMRDIFGDDLGPMPKGIDPDVPFSITFAQTQGGSGGTVPGSGGSGDDIGQRMIDNLVNLREKIEKELSRRAA